MSKGLKKLKARKAKRTKRHSDLNTLKGFFGADSRVADQLPSEPLPIRAELLNAARDLTCGERNRQYGDVLDNFSRTSAIRDAFWGGEEQKIITSAWGTALDMVLVKLGRIASAPTDEMAHYKDHYLDAINYLAIAYELAKRG